MSARFVQLLTCVGFALLLQLGFGGQQASAQTYNFSFNSGAGSGSIALVLSGLQVTGVVSGSGTSLLSGGTLSTINNANGTGTNPTLSNILGPTYLTSTASQYLVIDTATQQFQFLNFTDVGMGINLDQVRFYDAPGAAANLVVGFNIDTTLVQGPAPVPGAGLYSWMALIAGGLWINRKKIQGLAKGAAGRVSPRVG